MNIEQVKFEGIDSWNRPVFKSVKYRNRFGSVNELFGHDASEKEVLDKVSDSDLCFFGTSFGCEPMGTPADNIKIVSSQFN